MSDSATQVAPQPGLETPEDARPAHLVLRADWPIALCGARVTDHLGNSAPARDRCAECLRIAGERGLGRPGWLKATDETGGERGVTAPA